MNEKEIIFDSVIFDKDEKTFSVLNGTTGVYSYKNISKCQVLSEEAKYVGKTEPFSHAVVPGGYTTTPRLVQPKVYIGLKVKMKDDSIVAIYVSRKPMFENSFEYMNDRKEADKIKRIFDICIKKYK